MHGRKPITPAGAGDYSPALVPYPFAIFAAALLTDLVYCLTADPLWSTMSSWLLLIGLATASAAVAAEFVRLLRNRRLRRARLAWLHLAVVSVAVPLAALDFVFHVRDGYSAVVPAGPVLSAIVVVLLLSTIWMRRALVQRQPVATAETGATVFEDS